MKYWPPIAALAALSLTGCGGIGKTDAAPPSRVGQSVTATGSVTRSMTLDTRVDETADGVRIRVTASGISAGAHGMHVHEVGRCDAPAFTSAGAHWNPAMKQHGRDNPAGAHRGDLANLVVGRDRRGSAEIRIAGARLTEGSQPLFDEDGAALLIHAAADDYRTDPSGASGDRILCAVLQAAR